MEHDPHVTEPGEIAPPAEPIEDQTPPPGYEPQAPLTPDQDEGLTERPPGIIADAEAENPDAENPDDGEADDGDDDAEDGDPD